MHEADASGRASWRRCDRRRHGADRHGHRPGRHGGAHGHGHDRRGHQHLRHVSPDGQHVAFDLVTAIWTVPVAGGPARRLTGDDTDATQPSWSPDGKTLVFQAYRDGNYHLWTVPAGRLRAHAS